MSKKTKQKNKSNMRAGIRAVLKQLKPFKKEIIIIVILGLVSAVANGFVPYITGRFFDVLIDVSQGNIVGETVPLWMIFLGLWTLIQFIANNVDWFLDRTRRRTSTKLHLNIQTKGFIHLFNLPIDFHKNEKINEVFESISRAGWRTSAIFRNIVNIAPQLLSVVIGIVLSASINIHIAGIMAFGVLIYIILLSRILIPIAKIDEKVHNLWSHSWSDIVSSVQHIESVKQAASEKYESDKAKKTLLDDTRGEWVKLEMIWSNVGFFQRIIVFVTQFTIFLVSVQFISKGIITVGELVALNGYALMFFGPFVALGHSWQTIQNGLTSAASLDKVLLAETENYEPKDSKSLKNITGKIDFKNVSFGYDKDSPGVLIDINLSVNSGDIVALVGESGVGKSTTISLISGYYFPTRGSVLIDDIETNKLKLKELRQSIAVVPQEIALFNDTIKKNIKYGSFNASDEEIIKAAKEAHIDEFINSLPKKYNTVVGERGIKLSVGQKQRIAIARAILRDPKILILDEPTSALDAKTEQFITSSLEKLMKGRTTFIIAHRLSTVRRADKIFVFEKGRIVEEGKHDDLIKIENGVYRHLYEYQIGLK